MKTFKEWSGKIYFYASTEIKKEELQRFDDVMPGLKGIIEFITPEKFCGKSHQIYRSDRPVTFPIT